jgi:hypothetical protein
MLLFTTIIVHIHKPNDTASSLNSVSHPNYKIKNGNPSTKATRQMRTQVEHNPKKKNKSKQSTKIESGNILCKDDSWLPNDNRLRTQVNTTQRKKQKQTINKKNNQVTYYAKTTHDYQMTINDNEEDLMREGFLLFIKAASFLHQIMRSLGTLKKTLGYYRSIFFHL